MLVHGDRLTANPVSAITEAQRMQQTRTHSVDSKNALTRVARCKVGCRAIRCKNNSRLNDDILSGAAGSTRKNNSLPSTSMLNKLRTEAVSSDVL